jgi:hypothetical protein
VRLRTTEEEGNRILCWVFYPAVRNLPILSISKMVITRFGGRQFPAAGLYKERREVDLSLQQYSIALNSQTVLSVVQGARTIILKAETLLLV